MYCKRENKCIFMFQKNLWSFLVLHWLGFLWGIFHFWQNSSCILVKHKAQMVNHFFASLGYFHQILITCKMIICMYYIHQKFWSMYIYPVTTSKIVPQKLRSRTQTHSPYSWKLNFLTLKKDLAGVSLAMYNSCIQIRN